MNTLTISADCKLAKPTKLQAMLNNYASFNECDEDLRLSFKDREDIVYLFNKMSIGYIFIREQAKEMKLAFLQVIRASEVKCDMLEDFVEDVNLLEMLYEQINDDICFSDSFSLLNKVMILDFLSIYKSFSLKYKEVLYEM